MKKKEIEVVFPPISFLRKGWSVEKDIQKQENAEEYNFANRNSWNWSRTWPQNKQFIVRHFKNFYFLCKGK